jgi:hypothetical protein
MYSIGKSCILVARDPLRDPAFYSLGLGTLGRFMGFLGGFGCGRVLGFPGLVVFISWAF